MYLENNGNGKARPQGTCEKCQRQMMLVPLRITCGSFCPTKKCYLSLASLDYFFPCLYLGTAYTSYMLHLEQEVLHYVPQTLLSCFLYFNFDVLSGSSCCILVFYP